MSESSISAADRTRQAVEALRKDDIHDARALLSEALQHDPTFVPAWQWVAAVSDTPGEKKYALSHARTIDPDSVSAEQWATVEGAEATEPTFLALLAEAPPDDFDLNSFAAEHRATVASRRRRTAWLAGGAAILVALAVVGTLLANRPPDPVYVAVVDGPAGISTTGEVLRAAEAAIVTINGSGGLNGHPVEMLQYDDRDDPVTAVQVAQQIVADNRVVAVIGHQTSPAAEAAFPIYRDAKIPAITTTATADAVTANNIWGFRSLFDGSAEGAEMAAVLNQVSTDRVAYVVSVDNSYGKSIKAGFDAGFRAAGGSVRGTSVVPYSFADDATRQSTIQRVLSELKAAQPTGPVIMIANADLAVPLIKAMRAANLNQPVFGSDGLATGTLITDLTSGPDGIRDVSSIYVAAPYAIETLTGKAVNFITALDQQTGTISSWRTPTTYQAVDLLQQAFERGGIQVDGNSLPDVREALRVELDSARTLETSFPGIAGPVYFNDNQSQILPVTTLRGSPGSDGVPPSLQPTYLQYAPLVSVSQSELEQGIKAGTIVLIDGKPYSRQQLARVGVNINEIRDLDTASGTFSADAFLWMKYKGSDEPPAITFVNAVEPIDLGEPLRTSVGPIGEKYVLYRFTGTFKATLDFSAFPFDTQTLQVVIQDPKAPSSELIFTPDPDLLVTTNQERLLSGVNADQSIDDIPNWKADTVDFYPQVIGSTAALGDPTVSVGDSGLTYSQLVTSIEISRDVASFLVKNVLPLLLLVIATYIALWTPADDLATRVSFGVTGILTGAVLLQEVTSSLPNVDYSVAIQWAYYAFIVLSAGVVLESMLSHRLLAVGKLTEAARLDMTARILYLAGVVAVGFGYWWAFIR